jgi:hypothetical protein
MLRLVYINVTQVFRYHISPESLSSLTMSLTMRFNSSLSIGPGGYVGHKSQEGTTDNTYSGDGNSCLLSAISPSIHKRDTSVSLTYFSRHTYDIGIIDFVLIIKHI